jgi:hypothetical protein
MRRFVVWLGVMVLAIGMAAADGWAQRDAGAKIRGDFGPGFRRPLAGRRIAVEPARVEEREYRSFSVEPIGIQPGDMVAASKDGVPVMLGRETLGTLPKGTQFKVLKVLNGWVGGVIESEGKKLNGWVWYRNLVSAPTAAEGTQP